MGGKSLPRRITEGCQIRLPFVNSGMLEDGRAGTQKETEGSLANLLPPAAGTLATAVAELPLDNPETPYLTNNLVYHRRKVVGSSWGQGHQPR